MKSIKEWREKLNEADYEDVGRYANVSQKSSLDRVWGTWLEPALNKVSGQMTVPQKAQLLEKITLALGLTDQQLYPIAAKIKTQMQKTQQMPTNKFGPVTNVDAPGMRPGEHQDV